MIFNLKLPNYHLLQIRLMPIAVFDISLLRFTKQWTEKGKLFVYFHFSFGLANREPRFTKVLKLIFTWDYNRLIRDMENFKLIKEFVFYRRPYAKGSKQKNSG